VRSSAKLSIRISCPGVQLPFEALQPGRQIVRTVMLQWQHMVPSRLLVCIANSHQRHKACWAVCCAASLQRSDHRT